MQTESQKKAKKKYLSKGKRLTIDFYPSEAELIEHIEKQPAKQTYIKNLIRADMNKHFCKDCKLWHTEECPECADDPKANDSYGCFEK